MRRGKVRTLTLSLDAWQLIARHSPPLHILLLSMTCKDLKNSIRNDHVLWKHLFTMWELRTGGIWFPDFFARKTRPTGVPPSGWQQNEITDKALFNAAVRKVITLHYSKCCGLCGQVRRHTDPVWALNMRVCENCWRGNLISNSTLHYRYGVALMAPVAKDEPIPFIQKCFGKVLFFTHDGSDTQRKHFTCQPQDFDRTYRDKIMFFWEPHLRQIVDLDKLYHTKRQRQDAGVLLHALIRRMRVLRTIENTFKNGVTDGFANMNHSAKIAVLNNLQTKNLISTRRAYYHNRPLHFERLFYDNSGLLAAAKTHMGTLASGIE